MIDIKKSLLKFIFVVIILFQEYLWGLFLANIHISLKCIFAAVACDLHDEVARIFFQKHVVDKRASPCVGTNQFISFLLLHYNLSSSHLFSQDSPVYSCKSAHLLYGSQDTNEIASRNTSVFLKNLLGMPKQRGYDLIILFSRDIAYGISKFSMYQDAVFIHGFQITEPLPRKA